MSRKPNILLIFADQMRGHDVRAMGNRQIQTPNMDRLASEGALCTNGISNCPVCTPNRGTLLTGTHPTRHHALANDMPIRTDLPSLGSVLRNAGYRTGYIGKWHLDGVPRDKFTPPGERRLGFDDFWAVWNCHHQYFDGKYFTDTDEVRHFDGYEPEGQTDLAIDFVKNHSDEPFGLVVSWGPPHAPYELVPDRYLGKYDPADIDLRPNIGAQSNTARQKWQETLARYYAAITALDDNLGRLMQTLEELEIANDTLVIFTSDHGDMLGSQETTKKEKPWEESILVPLIWRCPSILPGGHQTEALIGTMDILPTILDLLEIDCPETIQGRSCAPFLRKSKEPEPANVPIGVPVIVDQGASQGFQEWRGVRTTRYT
ncbi:MAG: sulfatase, partial [Planctomycetes bacterium]|nr:sulfatase [Planctomycetota bacterium]